MLLPHVGSEGASNGSSGTKVVSSPVQAGRCIQQFVAGLQPENCLKILFNYKKSNKFNLF